MHRFFVSPNSIDGDSVSIAGDAARQLRRVLRARPGDQVVVLDNTGWEYLVTLDSLEADRAQGTVVEKRQSAGEPGVHITLYQAVLKGDRFELVLQKGAELGVSSFVPVFCARSILREGDRSRAARRMARWRKIVTEAAEQSRRGRIPELHEPLDFAAASEGVGDRALIPWEEGGLPGLRDVLRRWTSGDGGVSSVSVLIGPEGGFTPDEVARARSQGVESVSLGQRILRAETAGIVTAVAILYELGEMGG